MKEYGRKACNPRRVRLLNLAMSVLKEALQTILFLMLLKLMLHPIMVQKKSGILGTK
jgi:hypothetical protein